MKILSIVGARPQFIKCAPLSRKLRSNHEEILVHTGQHYDSNMSDVFFNELEIPEPDYNLGIGSGLHGEQTSRMLVEIEQLILKEDPELVLVYGDTNSTLAGALAASKLHIKIAHVEAGLRSFDRTMPEEINRVLTDHVSNILFCPTQTAVDNLSKEGIKSHVYKVGDVMADALNYNLQLAEKKSGILRELNIESKNYMVATVHRPSNTDNVVNLSAIIKALSTSEIPIIFPVHPRTKKYLKDYGLLDKLDDNIRIISPLGYLDMVSLMANSRKIITDSGGIQKEAYMLGIPCITLRENTEWIETIKEGWNVLVGADYNLIVDSINTFEGAPEKGYSFGTGEACDNILDIISSV